MGYQMLPALSRPYAQASTAIATPPAKPPFRPADIGYVSRGSHARTRSGATGTRSTMRRSVVMRSSSNTTGTVSSCSRGNTSRNQPTQPATARARPRTLTEALVRRPANIKVKPKAKTRGQAVEAGTSISTGARGLCSTCSTDTSVAMFFSSAAENVNDGENNDPHGIHKMPVHGQHLDASRLLRRNATCQPEKQHDAQQDQSNSHVRGVQANQRVVRCSEKVRRDGEPVFVNQAVPFLAGAVQEEGA